MKLNKEKKVENNYHRKVFSHIHAHCKQSLIISFLILNSGKSLDCKSYTVAYIKLQSYLPLYYGLSVFFCFSLIILMAISVTSGMRDIVLQSIFRLQFLSSTSFHFHCWKMSVSFPFSNKGEFHQQHTVLHIYVFVLVLFSSQLIGTNP